MTQPFPPHTGHRLHGSYEVMRGGHMNEAFVDFTGGVGEVLYLRQDTPGLFSAVRHALAKESLVGATALVRESAAHGDPRQGQSAVRAGARRRPAFFSLCSLLASLPHPSNSSKSKGNVFALLATQASGTAESRCLADAENVFFYFWFWVSFALRQAFPSRAQKGTPQLQVPPVTPSALKKKNGKGS